MLQPISASAVRYVKLGPGGAWFDRCRREGLLEVGYADIPHDWALAGRWSDAENLYVSEGRGQGVASRFVRELRDFYELGRDCLWITLEEGRLWWGFAEAEVTPVDAPSRGSRYRRVIDGWRDTSLLGEPLELSRLSTRLTKVGGFRGAICSVSEPDYLLRRLNGVEEQAVVEGRRAEAALASAALQLIQRLDWRDFELLVDLIFSTSGWRRTTAVGGADQADTDLVLEQAVTGEKAFVQVKSKADAAVLRDYEGRFRASGLDRMFFICHSPHAALASAAPGVHLWVGAAVADQAIKAGLFGWLIEKAR